MTRGGEKQFWSTTSAVINTTAHRSNNRLEAKEWKKLAEGGKVAKKAKELRQPNRLSSLRIG